MIVRTSDTLVADVQERQCSWVVGVSARAVEISSTSPWTVTETTEGLPGDALHTGLDWWNKGLYYFFYCWYQLFV